MTYALWSQDIFTKGELSPLMYGRVTLQQFYQGLKTAKNVLCFPQGSAGKRFGTRYVCPVLDATSASTMYFKSFQYLNECCYLVVLQNAFIDVYLGPNRVAHVASPILADEIQLIDHTIIENRFRVTTGPYAPYDLLRASNGANAITAFTADTLTITTPLTLNFFYPARFSAVAMPTTVPQIRANRTYFVRAITTTTVRIFSNAQDAEDNVNYYTISSAGTTANLLVLNTWTFTPVVFKNVPVFDFAGGYDTITFTPAAVSGFGITVTMSAIMTAPASMTSIYVGGVFVGNGGIGRISAVTDTTHFKVDIVQAFKDTSAIPGKDAFLAEPAWSATRLWPKKCSSFQNRAFFANTDQLTNGLWGSVTNDFDNFDGIEPSDPESAISWFPTSDSVNVIQFIVPYRSLTVHTNSGVYSTPLSVETAITPLNFSMSLQDTHPAQNVQPAGIDNQIIALSGNDAHSLLWDGFNNAYTSSIISIFNEQLLRDPVDEAPYADLIRAGSRYMFIINADGSLAIYQTLITENVSGFTPAVLEQSYGNAYFRWVTSNFDGRAWFVTERQIATLSGPYNITAFTSTTLTNSGYTFSTTTPTPFSFLTGTVPASDPQLILTTNYWAIGVTGHQFTVYTSLDDATNATNPVTFTNFGTTSTINAYPLVTNFLIEQLDFDAQMDCTGYYPTPTTAVPAPSVNVVGGAERFNAQFVLMQGDGFGFEANGVNGFLTFAAHGVVTNISSAQYGFPINVEITPLPISMSMTGNPKSSNIVDSKHVRVATFLFADTIGGTITQGDQTFPIALNTLNQIIPGVPPDPQTGSFEISVFNAWDNFKYNNFTINHTEPFGMKLTGIFYKLEV